MKTVSVAYEVEGTFDLEVNDDASLDEICQKALESREMPYDAYIVSIVDEDDNCLWEM